MQTDEIASRPPSRSHKPLWLDFLRLASRGLPWLMAAYWLLGLIGTVQRLKPGKKLHGY